MAAASTSLLSSKKPQHGCFIKKANPSPPCSIDPRTIPRDRTANSEAGFPLLFPQASVVFALRRALINSYGEVAVSLLGFLLFLSSPAPMSPGDSRRVLCYGEHFRPRYKISRNFYVSKCCKLFQWSAMSHLGALTPTDAAQVMKYNPVAVAFGKPYLPDSLVSCVNNTRAPPPPLFPPPLQLLTHE